MKIVHAPLVRQIARGFYQLLTHKHPFAFFYVKSSQLANVECTSKLIFSQHITFSYTKLKFACRSVSAIEKYQLGGFPWAFFYWHKLSTNRFQTINFVQKCIILLKICLQGLFTNLSFIITLYCISQVLSHKSTSQSISCCTSCKSLGAF